MFDKQIRLRSMVLYHCYGLKSSEVSVLLGPSKRSIIRWLKEFDRTGSLDPRVRPRSSRWPNRVLEFVRSYVEQNPSFILEELREELKDRYPYLANVSISTIFRALRIDLKLTRKRLSRRAIEARQSEIDSFKLRLSRFYSYPEQLVFVDETAKDGRDCVRRYGYSQRGRIAEATVPFGKGKRMSVCAAYDSTGFISWGITDGTFTRSKFHRNFLSEILPFLNPFPFPRSIVIMDNAAIHMYPELEEAIAAVGAILIYMPPFCPHLNPIEGAFGILKAWLRRYASLIYSVDPVELLHLGLSVCCKNTTVSSIVHCGYGLELDFSQEIS